MSPVTIVLLVILAVLIVATIALYFLGKKAQKRKDEQDAQLAATAQTVTMLIIDTGFAVYTFCYALAVNWALSFLKTISSLKYSDF